MKLKNFLLASAFLFILNSCSPVKNIAYLQDLQYGETEDLSKTSEITVKPGDKISIVVNSKDPLLADLFNLPIISHRVGYSQLSSLNQSQQISCYTVDQEGKIDFPVLGKVDVAGKNREAISALIKGELIGRNLVNDPVVTVEFANLYISVLGEVNKPGRYNIDQDNITLFDAIGMAGDLTIFGKRTDVVVMRESDGKRTSYKVDLTSSRDLYASPAYYLQQKDVVYVEPNDTRARQSTVNGNNVRSTSFWISLASLLTSVASVAVIVLK
ncbi:MAG: polysaccharide biosynthesis/export family protein [Dysgonamonadaceae bacterium]|jgi:polysaccharide export outer membrane protein|nr:polysaccharide biosynthesis/export family protein [Dysgonamonadaceae bacterium]